MPATLFINTVLKSKALKLSLIFIFSPLFFWGQTLTGLWTGALHNDSNTVRKDQSFEIALTEYNGKVYGYSRSEFIVDDTLYYILKRVKGTIEGDVCEVKDDEIISYNFRGRLDKGIKVTSTFRRNGNDSTWYLDGTWKTNATKKFYSVSGKVNLSNEKDLSVSKIFPHLEELNLSNEVAFYKDRTETVPSVRVAKTEKQLLAYTPHKEIRISGSPAPEVSDRPAEAIVTESVVPYIATVKKLDEPSDKPAVKEIEIGSATVSAPANIAKSLPMQQPVKTIAAENDLADGETEKTVVQAQTKKTPATITNNPVNKPVNAERTITSPVTAKTTAPANEKTELVAKEVIKKTKPAGSPAVAKEQREVSTTLTKNISQPVTATNVSTAPVNQPVQPAAATVKENTGIATIPVKETLPKPDITAKAAVIAGRKSDFSQIVNFKSDSITISLYDNGEIDGDTVSVFLNGEVLMARQGLKSSAIKKTIYINHGQEEDFTLVMFAESLGKYPPNTGLLVIRDGDDVYNLRFSSDFQKNAGIVFRKKK